MGQLSGGEKVRFGALPDFLYKTEFPDSGRADESHDCGKRSAGKNADQLRGELFVRIARPLFHQPGGNRYSGVRRERRTILRIFNLIEKRPRRYINTKIKRIHRYNYAKYGVRGDW